MRHYETLWYTEILWEYIFMICSVKKHFYINLKSEFWILSHEIDFEKIATSQQLPEGDIQVLCSSFCKDISAYVSTFLYLHTTLICMYIVLYLYVRMSLSDKTDYLCTTAMYIHNLVYIIV